VLSNPAFPHFSVISVAGSIPGSSTEEKLVRATGSGQFLFIGGLCDLLLGRRVEDGNDCRALDGGTGVKGVTPLLFSF
jgi:hypothetical protein